MADPDLNGCRDEVKVYDDEAIEYPKADFIVMV